MEAAKFRDSGEFSDCVQNVWGKTKSILHGAERPRNEFRPKALRNVGSGSRKRCQQETTQTTKGK